jgi:hypothetical protein
MTSGASYVRDIVLRRRDMVEPVEMMAEAALVLCSGSFVGQVTYTTSNPLARAVLKSP